MYTNEFFLVFFSMIYYIFMDSKELMKISWILFTDERFGKFPPILTSEKSR